MASHIVQHDQVRVIALTGPALDHVVVVTAVRPPQIGDIGTVVDIADRLGGVGRHYTVACGQPGAPPTWLATFAAHELELVSAG